MASNQTSSTRPAAWTRMQSLNHLQCHSLLETNQEALANALDHDASSHGRFAKLRASHPNIFAPHPVFVTPEDLSTMAQVVEAMESVLNHDSFRQHALHYLPASIRNIDTKAKGACLGYDFHLDVEGPKLIEINTNAGGLLLSLAVARAQQPCCKEVTKVLKSASDIEGVEEQIIEMFRSEFARVRDHTSLRRIAIVDLNPPQQFLFPEFTLYAELLRRHGIDCIIVDPKELMIKNGKLITTRDRSPIDLVYNRLTDFQLTDPVNQTLLAAYQQEITVVTPHPLAHALYANKENLVILSDAARLGEFGVDSSIINLFQRTIPQTKLVREQSPEQWWSERRKWFFKPADGYGSKAAYRGDKLSRRVFANIMSSAHAYVAQRVIVPGLRSSLQSGESMTHKYDIRNFAYAGNVQFVTARLYQGQTTNLRSVGGGFSPVWSEHSLA